METSEITDAPVVTGETPFLTAPFRGKNAFWRYFLGGVVPFIVSNIIGAIPLAVVMISYTLDGSSLPQKGGMPDFELMGIDLNIGFVGRVPAQAHGVRGICGIWIGLRRCTD